MNPEAILALISDLYTQVRQLTDQLVAVERERDSYKVIAEAMRPSEPSEPTGGE